MKKVDSDNKPKQPATRADGKFSQEAILDATLMIILEKGIRHIKYKTVAELAGVYPSAIAYHFKDMDGLIHAAFVYYLKIYKDAMNEARQSARDLISKASKVQHQTPEKEHGVFLMLVDEYSELLTGWIAPKERETVAYLLLDRIFRNEVLQNPRLYGSLSAQDESDIQFITELFTLTGAEYPSQDAIHLIALLSYLSELNLREMRQTKMKKAKVRGYSHDCIRSLLSKIFRPQLEPG